MVSFDFSNVSIINFWSFSEWSISYRSGILTSLKLLPLFLSNSPRAKHPGSSLTTLWLDGIVRILILHRMHSTLQSALLPSMISLNCLLTCIFRIISIESSFLKTGSRSSHGTGSMMVESELWWMEGECRSRKQRMEVKENDVSDLEDFYDSRKQLRTADRPPTQASASWNIWAEGTSPRWRARDCCLRRQFLLGTFWKFRVCKWLPRNSKIVRPNRHRFVFSIFPRKKQIIRQNKRKMVHLLRVSWDYDCWKASVLTSSHILISTMPFDSWKFVRLLVANSANRP